jgi:hypothetical protein
LKDLVSSLSGVNIENNEFTLLHTGVILVRLFRGDGRATFFILIIGGTTSTQFQLDCKVFVVVDLEQLLWRQLLGRACPVGVFRHFVDDLPVTDVVLY